MDVELIVCVGLDASEPLGGIAPAAERDHRLHEHMLAGLIDPRAHEANHVAVVLELCERR
ncbi:MAG: hypothetical protein E6I96_06115 [Chloroflexi bacterium]|nr:MAG: hypothetical protein E6I96_06115 [Chloroflexota bacterium]